jgi:hypothetical protein
MATNKPRGHTVRRSRSNHAVSAKKDNDPATRYQKNFNVALDRWLAESVLHEYDEDDEKAVQDIRYKLLTGKGAEQSVNICASIVCMNKYQQHGRSGASKSNNVSRVCNAARYGQSKKASVKKVWCRYRTAKARISTFITLPT